MSYKKHNNFKDKHLTAIYFSKVVGEWKAKADDLMAELDAAHSEARNYSNERFRLKSALTVAKTYSLNLIHVAKGANSLVMFFPAREKFCMEKSQKLRILHGKVVKIVTFAWKSRQKCYFCMEK